MSNVTTQRVTNPEAERDFEVPAFRPHIEQRSPLDQIVQEGTQRMLQTAIEAEADQFLGQYADRNDEQGKRLIVRTGYFPRRYIQFQTTLG